MDFKNSRNKWRTKSLILEFYLSEGKRGDVPPFTLKDDDVEHEGVKVRSLYKMFMESADTYDFACTHLGGIQHLNQFRKSSWFESGRGSHRGFVSWLNDMKQRDESLAKKALLSAVREGKIQAANKLYDVSTKTVKEKLTITEPTKVRKQKEDEEFLEGVSSRLNVINFRD